MTDLLTHEEYLSISESVTLASNSFVNGSFRPAKSGKTIPTINPATGETLTEIASCGKEDVDFAVQKAREAFDLSREKETVRERYGYTRYGQRALLARRLIEAGTSFANVVMEHPGTEVPAAKNVVYNWDCHAVNCHVFKLSLIHI